MRDFDSASSGNCLAFDFLRDVVHGVVATAYLLSVLQEGHNVGAAQHQELAPNSLLRLEEELASWSAVSTSCAHLHQVQVVAVVKLRL